MSPGYNLNQVDELFPQQIRIYKNMCIQICTYFQTFKSREYLTCKTNYIAPVPVWHRGPVLRSQGPLMMVWLQVPLAVRGAVPLLPAIPRVSAVISHEPSFLPGLLEVVLSFVYRFEAGRCEVEDLSQPPQLSSRYAG